MRAVFGIAALAISLTSQSVLADPIEPTAYPFLPQLTVNNEPAVCGSFESVVIEAFKGPQFQISIQDRDWPEAEVEWLSFSDLGIHVSREDLGAHEFVGALIDRDNDGEREVLTRAAWEHSWRGDMHFLTLYPNLESFKRARLLAYPSEPVAIGDGVTLSAILAGSLDMLQGSASGSEGEGTGLSGDDKASWKWSWVTRGALMINGNAYILDRGEIYDDDVAVSLWRIPPKGKLALACHVSLFVDDTGFSVAPLRQTAVDDFVQLLRRISGEEPHNGGTLHSQAQVLIEAGRFASRLAVRPWTLSADGLIDRRRESWALLQEWARQSIWNYRQMALFPKAEAAALKRLAAYYEADFGFSPVIAATLAQRALDSLLVNYIRSGYLVPQDGPHWDLRHALLERQPDDAIAAMLPPQDLTTPEKCGDIDCEPLLSYALGEERLIKLLLVHKINPNVANGFGKTPLMYAAQFGLARQARLLIDGGADVDATTFAHDDPRNAYFAYAINYTGRTALMYALENSDSKMIGLLLDAGADPNAKDSGGRDAMSYLGRNANLPDRERRVSEQLLRQAGYADAKSQP